MASKSQSTASTSSTSDSPVASTTALPANSLPPPETSSFKSSPVSEPVGANSDQGVVSHSYEEGQTSQEGKKNASHHREPEEMDNESDISDFSDFSQESWQPVQGPIAWVQEQMRKGQSPRKILEELVPSGTMIPDGLDPIMLWKIIINIVSEPPRRKKLHDINTLDDILKLLKTCKKILVLTGAGVSVSCGIPDFRSRDGVYARLAKDFPNLPDPQAMFDIHFFRSDPRPFFKFAREIYPGQFQPSLCHNFIRLLEEKGKLLRNYTQNIDTLEQEAGIQRVIQCHGSFATATCTECGHQVNSDAIKEDIFKQVIPHCPQCSPTEEKAVMKPDIVFFGESLPEHFHNQMALDKDECDLLIVIGSSLKVRPVALIPNSLPPHVPQILINRERLHYLNFDVELLGNCDDIVAELCKRLGPDWEQLTAPGPLLHEVVMSNLPTPPVSPISGSSKSPIPENVDDSSNATILASDNPVAHSESQPAFSSVSSKQSGNVPSADRINTPSKTLLSPSKDGAVQEVSTSHSEANIIKGHKGHHHKPSLKHSCASLTPPANSDYFPSSSVTDQACSPCKNPDQQLNTSCSKEEMDTIVNACHKKDVMYVPNKKTSHSHHGQSTSHNHHNHEQSKSHCHSHNQSSGHDHSKSPSHQHLPQSSSEAQVNNSVNTTPHSQPRPQSNDLSKEEQSEPTDAVVGVKRSLSNSEVLEADSQEEEGSSGKRPRLSSDSSEPDVDKKDRPDSASLEGSLDDIRKMWRSKQRVSLAQRLADDQILFLPPSRYIFKGAEVFSESESEDSDEDEDNDSSADSEEEAGDSTRESADILPVENSIVDSSSAPLDVEVFVNKDLEKILPEPSLQVQVLPEPVLAATGINEASNSLIERLDHNVDDAKPEGGVTQRNHPDTCPSEKCSPLPSVSSVKSNSGDTCPVSSTDDIMPANQDSSMS